MSCFLDWIGIAFCGKDCDINLSLFLLGLTCFESFHMFDFRFRDVGMFLSDTHLFIRKELII